jgi:hypothetical protein
MGKPMAVFDKTPLHEEVVNALTEINVKRVIMPKQYIL